MLSGRLKLSAVRPYNPLIYPACHVFLALQTDEYYSFSLRNPCWSLVSRHKCKWGDEVCR